MQFKQSGNVKIDVNKLNIDLLSLSAHKFYGPKGVGALYVRDGIKFYKLQDGGHQEKNQRAGTENVSGIVGLGSAISYAYKDIDKYNNHLKTLRDYYISRIQKEISYSYLNGSRNKRLPGNANISFKYIEGKALLLGLDMKGICASIGSACTAGSTSPSHVLTAIGVLPEMAQGSLRMTFGKENTQKDVDYLVDSLKEIIESLRSKDEMYNKNQIKK